MDRISTPEVVEGASFQRRHVVFDDEYKPVGGEG
jgi:hypothetical protein